MPKLDAPSEQNNGEIVTKSKDIVNHKLKVFPPCLSPYYNGVFKSSQVPDMVFAET